MSRVLTTLYPEFKAGGFARCDQRIIFFSRVNALLRPEMTVLDLGPGRGKFQELETGFKRDLTLLKGKVARVIGADPDPVVRTNPELDEAVVMTPGEPIPLPDRSIDLVVSWAALEHVEHAELYASELDRLLTPGGWLCAWTPNKWGYPAVLSRMVPNRFHTAVLKVMAPHRLPEDTFWTYYRMNTQRQLRRLFPVDRFEHFTYTFDGPPNYHASRVVLARFWQLYAYLTPPPFRSCLHIFIRKRLTGSEA